MTAQVIAHPALHRAERIEDKRREVDFLRADVRLHRAELEDAEGALGLAEQELADMERGVA